MKRHEMHRAEKVTLEIPKTELAQLEMLARQNMCLLLDLQSGLEFLSRVGVDEKDPMGLCGVLAVLSRGIETDEGSAAEYLMETLRKLQPAQLEAQA